MNPNQNDSLSKPDVPSPRSLPLARLCLENGDLILHPPVNEPELFAPFPLPKLMRTMTDWLAAASEQFYQQHGRCLAIVLLVDPAQQAWGITVPRQRCGVDGCCWSTSRDDFTDLPAGSVVAGSFQGRVLARGDEIGDCPPPHDGVHLVHLIGDQSPVAKMGLPSERSSANSVDAISASRPAHNGSAAITTSWLWTAENVSDGGDRHR